MTFFDTAEVYAPYINEELVGSALAPFKGKVVIATKFGFEAKPEDGRWTKLNSRPEHIRAVAEASLSDKCRCARPVLSAQGDLDVPIEETAGAVKQLIAEGKSSTLVCPKLGSRRFAVRTRCNP